MLYTRFPSGDTRLIFFVFSMPSTRLGRDGFLNV